MTRRTVSLGLLATLAAVAMGTARIAAGAPEKVNINTASVKDLQKLEGVGRGVAHRIVEYREANGPFKRTEDLKKVDGVGAATVDRNRDRIVVK
jgi:competence protein ComEA